MNIAPGRYWANVRIAGEIDTNCIIGLDEPMDTYFFQSGKEDDDGYPVVWLGTRFSEYTTLESLFAAMNERGLTVVDWEFAG